MGKLRHVSIQCDDPDRLARFYCEVFELEEMYRIGGDDGQAGAIYLSDGTVNLALIRIVDPNFPNYLPRGLNHIGFVVSDVAATVEKAKSFGAVTTRSGEEIVPGQHWEYKMEDPDGIGLDLYDPNGRGWPGISSLDDLDVPGTVTPQDHAAGRPMSARAQGGVSG